MTTAIDHTFRYPFPSELAEDSAGSHLRLATSFTDDQFPFFFDGELLYPRETAQLLLALARIAGTRYFVPPNMLKRLIAEADPVITCDGELLRLESFSACCCAYGRVDITPEAFKGELVEKGTTNVDFNSATQKALARTRGSDQLSFMVGADKVVLSKNQESIVEKKVKLPLRWLKGFVEVQAYLARMELVHELRKTEAIRFLRSIPTSANNRSVFYITQSGRNFRLSPRGGKDAVRISGLKRLKMVESLAPLADSLRIYATPTGDSTSWELTCGPLNFHWTLSPDVWRGFSGEGQILSDVATTDFEAILGRIKASLSWQSDIKVDSLAKQLNSDQDCVRTALGVLGSQGLVGYDVARRTYFHRELPFSTDSWKELHPRLKGAEKILSSKKVKIVTDDSGVVVAEVPGSGVTHRIKLKGDNEEVCTCVWYSKHAGERGPCKHILAVQMFLEERRLEGV